MLLFPFYLPVHDASGKLNSGILNGNINQPGDFDQCLGIQQRMKDQDQDIDQDEDGETIIRGQYCLAYAQPVLPHKSKRLQSFFKLIQSHGPFKSEFNDVSICLSSVPGSGVPFNGARDQDSEIIMGRATYESFNFT